jgi:hypothetical protein
MKISIKNASLAIAFLLLLSCSMPGWVPFFGDDDDDDEETPSSSSRESAYFCQISNTTCIEMSVDDCIAVSGLVVNTCSSNQGTPSSSSATVNPPPNQTYLCQGLGFCIEMSIEDCMILSGSVVSTCSGNQGIPSSSSATVNPPPNQTVSSSSKPSSSSAAIVTPSSSSRPAPNLLWDLYEDAGGVRTGGGWFAYDDSDNGGNSTTNFSCSETSCLWQNRDGTVNFNFSPYEAYDDYNGYYYNAFAAVGFAWLASGNKAPSVWGNHTGLCVEYSLSGTGDFYVKIHTDGYLSHDDYRISLPKRSSVGKTYFAFNDFSQEGWGTIATLATAKNNSIGIVFQGSYNSTATATLTLRSIRWDSCN